MVVMVKMVVMVAGKSDGDVGGDGCCEGGGKVE